MNLEKLKNSTMLKLGITGFMTLLFLIPLGMISDQVRERTARRDVAVNEVSSKWGYNQKVIGPVLTIPYQYFYLDQKNVVRKKRKMAYFLPEQLKINGRIETEKRSRGIFEVVLYKVDNLDLSGKFRFPDFKKLKINEANVFWEDAFISVGISDTRGIKKKVALKLNRKKYNFEPGVNNVGIYSSGIHVPLKKLRSMKGRDLDFGFTVNIQGSSSLSVAPFGKETLVYLHSPWEHPSFFGSYLPLNREISEEGFNASWKVSYFGRNFPQEWTEEKNPQAHEIENIMFGVSLYMPVDFYQKCQRAVKYSFLVISLTFLVFFLFEILNGLSIHPIQYIMVGFALSIFYMLFLSISEHLNFVLSYILSSAATIGLISAYSTKVLKAKGRTSVLAGLLVCLYGYLFVLLQNQDYALLIGSLGLFLILATVMYITRNIDWYNIKLNGRFARESG
jgi:inner membrane protein